MIYVSASSGAVCIGGFEVLLPCRPQADGPPLCATVLLKVRFLAPVAIVLALRGSRHGVLWNNEGLTHLHCQPPKPFHLVSS